MERVLPYLPYIMGGFGMTVLIAVLSICAAMIIGFLFTLMRRSRFRLLKAIGVVCVEVFRGTSEVVQMYWIFFAMPILLAVQLPPLVAAVLVLGFNGGAYASEVMRGGLAGVPRVQQEACVALSFSRATAMRRVVFPQAFAIMLPSLANVAINTTKATSVVSLVTIADLAFRVQTVRINTGESVICYLIALGLYLVLTTAIALCFETAERNLPGVKPAKRRLVRS